MRIGDDCELRKTVRLPADLPVHGVEGDQALPGSADLDDDGVAISDRAARVSIDDEGAVEVAPQLVAPEQCAALLIEAQHASGRADRVNLAVVQERRRVWSAAVGGIQPIVSQRRVAELPDRFSSRGVERDDELPIVLPVHRDEAAGVADDGGMPFTEGAFPDDRRSGRGPARCDLRVRNGEVAMRSAPLRPGGCRCRVALQERGDQERTGCGKRNHPLWSHR